MGCISHFLGICNAPERFSIHHPSKSLMFGMFHMISPSRKKKFPDAIQQNENNSCKFLPDQISQQNPTPPKSTHNHTHLPSSVASRRPSAVPTEKRVLQTNVCAMPAVPWPVRVEGLGFPQKSLVVEHHTLEDERIGK